MLKIQNLIIQADLLFRISFETVNKFVKNYNSLS